MEEEQPLSRLEALPLEITQSIIDLAKHHGTADALALVSRSLRNSERACRRRVVLRYDDIPTKIGRRLSDSFPGVRKIAIKRHCTTSRKTSAAKSRDVIKNGLLDGTFIISLELHNIPRNELRSLCTESAQLTTIRHLDLSGCTELSDRTLGTLLRSLGKLEELDISRCSLLTLAGILVALKHDSLVELRATHLHTENTHQTLGMEVSPSIRRLYFAKTVISDDVLLSILGLAHRLVVLDLSHCSRSNRVLEAVSALDTLQELSLTAWNQDGVDFSLLAKMRHLQTLSLGVCWKFNSDSVRYLLELDQLSSLDLSHCDVTTDDLCLLMNKLRAPSLTLDTWAIDRDRVVKMLGELLGDTWFVYYTEKTGQHSNVLTATFLWTDKIRFVNVVYPKKAQSFIHHPPIVTVHNSWGD